MDLTELQDRTEVAAGVLEVASQLLNDNYYAREEAAKDLLKTLKENDFLPRINIDLLENHSN